MEKEEAYDVEKPFENYQKPGEQFHLTTWFSNKELVDEFIKGKDDIIKEKIKLIKKIKESDNDVREEILYGIRFNNSEDLKHIDMPGYWAYKTHGISLNWEDEGEQDENDEKYKLVKWFDDKIEAEEFQASLLDNDYKKIIIKVDGKDKYGIEVKNIEQLT